MNDDVCTCCGQMLPPTGLSVNFDKNRLVYRGKGIRMQPQMVNFLAALIEHQGKPIAIEKLATKVWGRAAVPRSYRNILTIYYRRAQKALQVLGFDVLTIGRGHERTFTLARATETKCSTWKDPDHGPVATPPA